MHCNAGDPSCEERLYEYILALLSKRKFNMFLTELKYDALSHNFLKLFKKAVPEQVLSHFAGFCHSRPWRIAYVIYRCSW